MRPITNAVMTVYNFFVGDPVILAGILITFLLDALLYRASALRPALGAVLIAGVVISLALALYRETQPKKK